MARPPIGEIANNTDRFMAGMVSNNQKMLQNSILLLENRIVKGVNALETTSTGALLGPQVNLKQAQKIHSQLATMFDETYGDGVRRVLQGYPAAAEYVVNTISQDLNAAAEFTGFDRDMMKALQQQDMGQFAAYGQQAQEQITQALYAHVSAGANMNQLRGTIAGHLLGSVDARGRSMASYARQFANDSVMNFHNAVVLQKGEEAGFNRFLYYGNIMATTRDFCRRRAMRVYSREEIESWNFRWAGKSGPAMTHRGGYNCRHHWQPVLDEWVPEGELPVQEYATAEERFAMSPEEQYLKKQLNQLRYNIKTGKNITLETPLVADMWYHMHPQERQNLFSKWYKAGIFANNKQAAKILSYDSVPGKAPPLSKAPPLKVSGTMLTESPNAKFPKPKVAVVDEDDIDILDETDIVPKPTPVKKPPKPKPEPVIVTEDAVDGSTNGKAWNDLTAEEKKVFGNYGYKMKVGKFKYHPTFANVWESLSSQAQNAKIASWKNLGYTIPNDLPIKKLGAGVTVTQPNPVAVSSVAKPKIKPPKTKVTGSKPNWSMDAPGLAEEQFEKSIGVKAVTKGFDQAEGAVIVNNSGDHMWDVFNNHPKLKTIVKKTPQVPEVTFVNSALVNKRGAVGTFSDITYKMEVAAKNRKFTHSLNLNKSAFSVGGDYYSTLRHEYGHYLDKVLRETTDHQNQWRALYKSYSKAEWKKIFGTYSSTDKYEGFAEAFSAYTSPLYKPGMMPAKVEKYMKKILGDKRTFKPAEELFETTVSGTKFKSSTNEKAYKKWYAYFKKKKITQKYAKDYLRSETPMVMEALDNWQGTTQSSLPMGFKLKCSQLFADKDIAFFAKASSNKTAAAVAEYADRIPDLEVIKIRALTQAYYDQKKVKKVRIKRGTDGRTSGPKFNAAVNDLKSKTPEADWDKTYVELEEPVLNGWTTSDAIGKNFSSGGKGIFVDTEVPVEDILLPHELWPKRSFKYEKEFIVIRRKNQKYKLSDIRSNYKIHKPKAAAPEAPTYLIEDDFTLATDVWLLGKPDDIPSLSQEKMLALFKKKIAGLKKLSGSQPLKVGFSDLGKGGPNSTMVYLSPKLKQDWINYLEEVAYNIENKWTPELIFDIVNPDPWAEV